MMWAGFSVVLKLLPCKINFGRSNKSGPYFKESPFDVHFYFGLGFIKFELLKPKPIDDGIQPILEINSHAFNPSNIHCQSEVWNCYPI